MEVHTGRQSSEKKMGGSTLIQGEKQAQDPAKSWKKQK